MMDQFNWNPKKVELILGPPGTGKTTTLMNKLDEALQIYHPKNICFVAFTRKAANEAVDRAISRFQLPTEDFMNFRTLHSFAFRSMGYSSKQVMGPGDYIEIATSLGEFISYRGLREDGSLHGQTKGDRLLFLCNLARLQNKTLPEIHSEWLPENLDEYELIRMHETIEQYKRNHGKKDFTDIIEEFIESGYAPPFDILFVDEAQDLAPMQWTMVAKLAENSGQVFIAGDDDQAIFRWAGADVGKFIHLDAGTRTVLNQSYRVPSKVATCANRVISTISDRITKPWKPRLEQGIARFIDRPDLLDLSKGTWLLLARNSYLLQTFTDICISRGYVFESSSETPIDREVLVAVKLWESLRKGRYHSIDQVLKVYTYMSTKIGVAYGMKTVAKNEDPEKLVSLADLKRSYGLLVDTVWHEALDRIPDKPRQYLLTALRNGEKIDGESRIKISTIHGVKGGEADNVVLCTDMAARTYREYQNNRDDEARVWYVAITRARENLYMMWPRTPNHYPLDDILRKH